MSPGRALRTSRWKYAVTAPEEYKDVGEAPEYVETHLYDLRTDPYELKNLIDLPSHSPVRERFRKKLIERMAEAGEAPARIREVDLLELSGQRTVDYPNS